MVRRFLTPFVALAALLVSGCLSMRSFVDPSLGEVSAAERAVVADPRPVQLIFEFRTKGAANARATNLLRAQVTEIVQSSGFFSEVSSDPVAGGALLSVIVDNVPQEDAAARGFATGLTFGLAGTVVADYYEGSARYAAANVPAEISATRRHTLHTMVGAGEGPANMVQAANPEEGVRTVIRQLIQRMLNDVAGNPGFTPTAVAPEPVG